MALADLTFKFYNDAAGTDAFDGTLNLVHETDLSDNPQDTTLYLLSNTADRFLNQADAPGVNQITLTPTNGIPAWIAATSYSLGDTIEPTTANSYAYVCTTAGVSDASTEPTFPTSGIGSTVVDGTAVWTLRGKRHQTTEIKLALTALGLDSATAGAALDIGVTLDSLVANKVDVYVRVENAVTTVCNTTGFPDVTIDINSVDETA
jgi:hypothetical protein